MIIVITGASGVGKTSALKELSNTFKNIKVYHFDDMGLPDWDTLENIKQWQQEATLTWVDKLVEAAKKENMHILFEGSTEIKFYLEGFERNNYTNYKVLLFDANRETMKKRLVQRGQPELYNTDMISWADYLRNEATARNIQIIHTDNLTITEVG